MSSTSTTSSTSSSGDLGPYFTWFLKAVAKWLDIALFKAVQRILKVNIREIKITYQVVGTVFLLFLLYFVIYFVGC